MGKSKFYLNQVFRYYSKGINIGSVDIHQKEHH